MPLATIFVGEASPPENGIATKKPGFVENIGV
jgi:hypothetical protein